MWVGLLTATLYRCRRRRSKYAVFSLHHPSMVKPRKGYGWGYTKRAEIDVDF